MRRLLVVAASATLLLSIMVGTAVGGQGNNGAGKAPMYVGSINEGWTCEDGAMPTDESFGFVVMNLTGDGNLVGTLSLKGARPSFTYTVAIVGDSLPLSCPGTPVVGTLTTNAKGNGNLHFEIDEVDPLVPQGQVWVIAVDPSDVFGPRLQSAAVDIDYPNS